MIAIPLTLAEANDLVARLHRHHDPVVGHRFSIGAKLGDDLVGAVIADHGAVELPAGSSSSR